MFLSLGCVLTRMVLAVLTDPSAKRKDQTEGGELRLSLTFQKLDQ